MDSTNSSRTIKLFQNIKQNYFTDNHDIENQLIKKIPSPGLCLKYSQNDQYIAIGCQNGSLIIYDATEKSIILKHSDFKDIPIISLSWIPIKDHKNYHLITGNIAGQINIWKIPQMKIIHSFIQNSKSMLTFQIDSSGQRIATTGMDGTINIYNLQKKSIQIVLKKQKISNLYINPKIFSMKFLDHNTLITGGSERIVRYWDIRQEINIKNIYEIQINNDTLDYQNDQLLAGAYSIRNQIQIYTAHNIKKYQQIDLEQIGNQSLYVSAARFSKNNPKIIGTGSSGDNCQVVLYKDKENQGYKKILSVSGMQQGIYSLDFAHNSQKIAFTTGNSGLYIYQYCQY